MTDTHVDAIASTSDASVAGASISAAVDLLARELGTLLRRVAVSQGEALELTAGVISSASAVFVHGAGRSGIAVRGLAMRLMHLGKTVHVVGDTTTPAIGAGDVLIAVSGSGTTAGVVRAAETAVTTGAHVVAITNDASSTLGRLAKVSVVLGAASKTDFSGTVSQQYAGSLFEQSVAIIGDAIFHTLWQRSGLNSDQLWPQHANLE